MATVTDADLRIARTVRPDDSRPLVRLAMPDWLRDDLRALSEPPPGWEAFAGRYIRLVLNGVATITVASAAVLVLAGIAGWGQAPELFAGAAAVTGIGVGIVYGVRSGHEAVAVRLLSLMFAVWPVMLALVVVATARSGGAGGQAVLLISAAVCPTVAALLPRRLALGWLALTVLLVGGAAAVAGLPASAGVAAMLGILFAATIGLEVRRTVERLWLDRGQTREIGARLPETADLMEAAAAITAAVVESCGVDAAVFSIIEPEGTARHLSHTTRPPIEMDIVPGTALSVARSETLRSRAADGPWMREWGALPAPEDGSHQMYDAGLRTVAYVPVRHAGDVVGVIGAALTAEGRRASAQLAEQLPLLVELAGLAESAMGTLLAGAGREASAREAIQRVLSERAFSTVFQPIVNLGSGRIVGFEALTRFDDGARPDLRFLEARRLGLGPALEAAAIVRAMELALRLPADAWLALNASPELVASKRLVEALSSTTRPIVVEITEHASIDDYGALRSRIDALGSRIRLAVDDAGAGFASLRHVVELHPSIVKLDRAIVADIDADPARQAVVAGLRHFAERIGCALVAEGIERPAELDTIRSLGVELGQGYLLGRPAPASVWLETSPEPSGAYPRRARSLGAGRPYASTERSRRGRTRRRPG